MERIIRYGIIGAGMMGIEHIRNLQAIEGVVVTAVADPSEVSRDAARRQGVDGGTPIECFESHAALLESGLCDVIVISTPNMTHAEILQDVLATSFPVLVEKPLCTTLADSRRIVNVANERDAIVWVGLEYRYMPPIARLIREVHSGAVGRVRMVAMREHRFPFLAKVDDWNRFNENSGGTLVEKCCHFFDLMNCITRSSPVNVYASGGQDVNHLDERYNGRVPDILDNALVIVNYDDGCRASLDLCMFAEGSVNQEEISVVGDLGKAEAFLPSGEFRMGTRLGGRASVESTVVTDERVGYQGFHHGSSYLEHLDFLSVLRSGGIPSVTVESGMLAVAVGIAAQRSIEQGRVVEIAEVLSDPLA
jgi:predicted dehydrogenase